MSVSHSVDALDVKGVAPDGVLSDIGHGRRYDDVVVERHLLTFLGKHEVAICILKGIDAVFARCHAFDDEAAAAVGACETKHWLRGERTVLQVGIESYENALDRFHVLRLHHIARHLKGVDMVAGGEAIGIVAQRIAFVVVGNGVREINGVGGVRHQ